MARVRGADTKPEMIVRRLAHSLGYRFRLHRRDLPGRPDMVFPRHKLAVFVHGCFWHGHDCRRGDRLPKTNAAYWKAKIGRNKQRDADALAALRAIGWRTMVVWECELRDGDALAMRFTAALSPSNPTPVVEPHRDGWPSS